MVMRVGYACVRPPLRLRSEGERGPRFAAITLIAAAPAVFGGFDSWNLFEQCDGPAYVTFTTSSGATATIDWGGETADKVYYCTGGGCDGTAYESPYSTEDLHGQLSITTAEMGGWVSISDAGCS